MNRLSPVEEVPQWLQRASRAVARLMEDYDIRSFSSLHTETGLNYRTLKKLDPRHIDTTISYESVAKIFARLFLYIKESQGLKIGEDDDYDGLDTEWANVTAEYFGTAKSTA